MSVNDIKHVDGGAQLEHRAALEIPADERVGPRLKLLRERRGLSQRELARRAGVTNASVSQIEQDRVSPSVASLRKLAGALGVSLAEFFASQHGPPPSPFQSAAELLEIGSGGVSLKLVGGAMSARTLQMLREHYEAGADTGPTMLQHAGEECGLILRGAIEVTVGAEVRVLREGDAFYFASTTPHRFRNLGDAPCELVTASTPATF
ncbi:MAG: hypothetical protein CVU56_23045 [Deltaproteobacteria bacterium HGW-Deltaproteobacteria-14]|jgi:transcriptional regulator with XRE-family HTH domain|nr:MAG: hypothetical protein CVU56_23045 [Deltaproteobacteria bacterium HGW-Deltaproteobacteria-14]